ncbi:NDP-sugar synthase [Streptomyces sp. NPDC001941]|uniref:NDP-sugar synthase n=1 Tax=Streptomyces sp. NPDC001941 TaxID=3154659 RepID=UPI00331B9EC5
MSEAILLVGGRGTRLRPLTTSTPKPLLRVAGVPFLAHQLARAAEAGVTRVVFATSYLAECFEAEFGTGDAFGLDLVYVTETEPLGTGGAIRNAARHLTCGGDEPVLVFNGDILSGLDVAGLRDGHAASGADVSLHLTRVPDPRAFGLVPTDPEGRVLGFLEKPTSDAEIVTDQVNAGCYVFTRTVIDRIPDGRPVSVERETFPALLAEGAHLRGVLDDSYWLDLGTPAAFVRGSADLVQGLVHSPALPGSPGQALVLASAHVDPLAVLTAGTTVCEGAVVEAGAIVEGSVVLPGSRVEADAVVHRSVVGRHAVVGTGSTLHDVVVGDSAYIGPHNEIPSGVRLACGTALAAQALRTSAPVQV